MFVGQLTFANQCIPIAHSGRFDADQQLPSGCFRARQVNVGDDTRWTELKYSGCFHLSSSKVRLTRDQYRIRGSSFSNVLVAPLAAQLLQVALPGTSNDRGYTSFHAPTPPCPGFALLSCVPWSSIGFQLMVHVALHSLPISLLLEPLSVADSRQRVGTNQPYQRTRRS